MERRLYCDGWKRPYDYAYLANYPSVHLPTALRLDHICHRLICSKPVDSNFELMRTLYEELHRGGPWGTW